MASTLYNRPEHDPESSKSGCPYWFTRFPHAATFDRRLRPLDRSVLLVRLAYAGEKGWCDVSQPTIGEHLGYGRKEINESDGRLLKYGYLRKRPVPKKKIDARGKPVENATCREWDMMFCFDERVLPLFDEGVPVPKSFRHRLRIVTADDLQGPAGEAPEGDSHPPRDGTTCHPEVTPSVTQRLQLPVTQRLHKEEGSLEKGREAYSVGEQREASVCDPEENADERPAFKPKRRPALRAGSVPKVTGRSADDARPAFEAHRKIVPKPGDADLYDVRDAIEYADHLGRDGVKIVEVAVDLAVKARDVSTGEWRIKPAQAPSFFRTTAKEKAENGIRGAAAPADRSKRRDPGVIRSKGIGSFTPLEAGELEDEPFITPAAPQQPPTWMKDWHLDELRAAYPEHAHKALPLPPGYTVDAGGKVEDERRTIAKVFHW